MKVSGDYAVVEASGKQFWVEPNKYYDIDRLPFNPGDEIVLNRVLATSTNGSISIGQPCLNGKAVQAKILRHLRGPKVTVYKMRPKKKTRLKQGHRQELTRIFVDSI